MKQCQQCGAELRESARFCSKCGARQTPPDGPGAGVDQRQPPAGTETTIRGDAGTVLSGQFTGPVTVNELPPAVLALFARQFGFDLQASDAEALRAYFNQVVFERHSRLSFLFIRPETGKVYTEADVETVFVPLQLADPEASARLARQLERFGRSRGLEEAARPLSLPEVIAKYPCFLLRGKPGCGKTTLLRHIALAFARGEQQEKLGWSGPPLLPLLVPLRNFGAFLKRRAADYVEPQPRALLEYLEEHLRGAGVRFGPDFLRQRLAAGHCFLLLDALDEVSGELDGGSDLRAEVARQVAAFIRRYQPQGNRFALTARPRAFQDNGALRQALPQPQVCDVFDLDAAGYRRLIGNLLQVLTGNAAAGQAEAKDLCARIAANRNLAELAGNPLLCTTLVLVYKYRGRKLPERRVDVLHEIVTLLLGRWEEERRDVTAPGDLARLGTNAPTTEQAIQFRRRALTAVAWAMQTAETAELPATAAEQVLADFYCQEERTAAPQAAAWARHFLTIAHERSGLFIAVDEGLHAFAHQAFREYLAATALVNAGESRLLETVLAHAPQPDTWWEQVLLLAGAHPELALDAAGRLVGALLARPEVEYAYLAARYARDMLDRLPGAARKALQDRLLSALRDAAVPAQTRALAGRGLAWAGDPRFRADAWYLPAEPLLGFVAIPAGPFPLGEKQAQHPVTLPAYWLARYPVTNAQYGAFVQAGGYAEPAYWREAAQAGHWRAGQFQGLYDDAPRSAPAGYGEPFDLPNHPVVGVTWYEALAYSRWLDAQLRAWAETPPVLQAALAAGYAVTLPSEAEWEKAARGGVETPRRGRSAYPWGNDPDPNRANYNDTGIGSTSAVGAFPGGASPYAIEDLAGNVWEWTRSLARDYPYRPDDGREDLTAGADAARVLWGGAFDLNLDRARCASRFGDLPLIRNRYFGFRVVVSPSLLCSAL